LRKRTYYILRTLLILLATAFFVPAIAQNTKGDRPLDNRGKVRQTHAKNIKKKGRVTTKDIAGRRLRTKNKSSANRANVGIPQPLTTQRQPRRRDDRAARVPSNKTEIVSKFRRRSDPDRQWQGDISGYKQRKIRPSSAEESGRNVYPQGKYASKHPKPQARPFKGYEGRTASGKPVVKRSPKHSERAWKGDLRGQPFYPPSTQTGKINNVYPQKTRYSKYVTKRPSTRDRAYNNRDAIQKARLMGTGRRPNNWNRGGTVSPTGQAPFVTRGRKNVYWGKMKVGGKAKTRDLAGRPLQKKNFRSTGIGITGRDTLAFFGRRPHGDVGAQRRRGKFIPGSEARGGWLNDIAGYRLRKKTPGAETVGDHRYSGFRSITGKYRTNGKLPGKAPGIGAGAIEKHLQRTKGGGGRDFQDQGGAFTGFLKSRRPGNYHGNRRNALWNNNGLPVAEKALPGGGLAAGRFSGRIRGGGKNYGDQGSAYTGDIKRQKLYGDNAENYRGFLKTDRRSGKFVGSLHRFWNNSGSPVAGKALPGSGLAAGRFSGKIRGGPDKNFSDQGSAYTGDIKRRKAYTDGAEDYRGFLKAQKSGGKYVGTVHRLWNNKGKATTELETNRDAALAGSYRGHTKANARGKALLIPSKLWNNNGKAVTKIEATKAGALAGYFQGHTKAQAKGKAILVPSKLWNNNGRAVTHVEASKDDAAAGSFQGRTKAKKQEKYPLNSANVMWNNKGKATTQIRLTGAGVKPGTFQGRSKYKKESKDRDANIEDRIRIKEQYVQAPHSVDEALKKQKPELNYKAGRFASGAKVVGKRTHNPHSVDDALDVYHSQASARRIDYQGNVKMRKFADRRQSPDAKFVKTGENNVKDDRTLFTNVKLLWAKLFQRSDSQPSNLKERSNKLRYDKGEKGLWAD
jgi:hypothetical protein